MRTTFRHLALLGTLVAPSRAGDGARHSVTVMTRNLYIGTDVDPLITALLTPDPTDDVPALMAAITEPTRTTSASWRPPSSSRGAACCELANLSNKVNGFDQRIDYVWTRGFGEQHGDDLGRIILVGNKPGDKIAGVAFPVWPSDHAGVVASRNIAPAGTGHPHK